LHDCFIASHISYYLYTMNPCFCGVVASCGMRPPSQHLGIYGGRLGDTISMSNGEEEVTAQAALAEKTGGEPSKLQACS
jgi:hypothetical protein